MKHLKIPEDLAQEVANYLARQPWAQVNGMMARLLSLEPLEEEDGTDGEGEAE